MSHHTKEKWVAAWRSVHEVVELEYEYTSISSSMNSNLHVTMKKQYNNIFVAQRFATPLFSQPVTLTISKFNP